MTEKEKQDLLEEVWNNCSFDEIIDKGFEMNKCGAIDLKVAADEFEDNVGYEDYDWSDKEIEAMVKRCDERTLFDAIKYYYDLDDFLRKYWYKDDVFDCYDKDDLLDYLDGSWELDKHNQSVRENARDDIYEEVWKDFEEDNNNKIDTLRDNPDELWRFFAKISGCGYYNEKNMFREMSKLIYKLNDSSYKSKDIKKWILS